MSLDDLARRGRALSILLALAHGKVVNMREFTRASKLVPERAKALREDMVEWGLLEVKVLRNQGAADILEIRLTAVGGEIAGHVVEIARLLEEGASRRRRRGG